MQAEDFEETDKAWLRTYTKGNSPATMLGHVLGPGAAARSHIKFVETVYLHNGRLYEDLRLRASCFDS